MVVQEAPSPENFGGSIDHRSAIEGLYGAISQDRFLERLDLDNLLEQSARTGINLSPDRISDYSLFPLRVKQRDNGMPNYFGYAEGFYDPTGGGVVAKQFPDGRYYKIYLNRPVGIGLCYKGSPQAVTSFSLEVFNGASELVIGQIQGIKSYRAPVSLSPKDIRGSRGLAPLNYPELMIRISETTAKRLGVPHVSVTPSEYIISKQLINSDVDPERAGNIYDAAPKSLGYERALGMWRREVT